MLKPACRWIQSEGNAFLHWHYRCIATVKRRGGRYTLTIDWGVHEHTGQAVSLAQGMRFVERWVGAQEGLPTLGRGRR